jgi:hypothetical protein
MNTSSGIQVGTPENGGVLLLESDAVIIEPRLKVATTLCHAAVNESQGGLKTVLLARIELERNGQDFVY